MRWSARTLLTQDRKTQQLNLDIPIAVTEVKDVNGDVIWSTISTALLRIVNVTYGQSFTSTDNVSGVLQEGKSYTFDVRPQINSQTGEFLGGQLQLSFGLLYRLAQLKKQAASYTFTQEPTTYTTVSDQTVTQSSYAQTITTVC